MVSVLLCGFFPSIFISILPLFFTIFLIVFWNFQWDILCSFLLLLILKFLLLVYILSRFGCFVENNLLIFFICSWSLWKHISQCSIHPLSRILWCSKQIHILVTLVPLTLFCKHPSVIFSIYILNFFHVCAIFLWLSLWKS